MANDTLQLITGDSPFLVDDQLAQIRQSGLEVVTVSDKQTVDELMTEWSMVSMFGQRRLHVQTNPAWLLKPKDPKDVPDFAEWVTLLNQSGEQFVVVVTGSLDRRKKLTKGLLAAAKTVTCNGFKDWEMDKCLTWLNDRAKRLGVVLEPKAAQLLVDMYGIQVEKLAQAVQMADLYTLHHDRAVSVSDVQALFPEADASVFSLGEAIKKGQFPEIYEKVQRLLTQKMEPIYLMAVMMGPVRMAAQCVLSGQVSADQLARSLGRNPYFVKRLLSDFKRHMTTDKILRIYRSAVDIDVRIKSGRLSGSAGVLLFCEAFR